MKVHVSITHSRCAKIRVIKHFEGNASVKFAKLEDYAEKLKRSNKGNTVILEAEEGTRIFKRMYVCFAVMMKGFKVGYYKVFGLDCCFIKASLKGEILSVIKRDANNQINPVAWAMVMWENKDN